MLLIVEGLGPSVGPNNMRNVIELHCTRDLALKFGALEPKDNRHHRQLRNAGHLLVRDIETSRPMFWTWALPSTDVVASATSS